MENILSSLLSSLVASSNSVIRMLMNNLMDICFYAEKTIEQANPNGVQISLDALKTLILSFSIGLIILKFLKKGFDMYVLWTERRIRVTNSEHI